ncbi:MAG: zinc ABC transporter solute-binding protein [Elusimicrobia bacterium]|nr:zinc ABC transporter solute-binding protein [Elusimicrobiota bacterium]
MKIALAALLALLPWLSPGHTAAAPLKIAASSFPVYDFARVVAGDRAEVFLLSPPGSNTHSFEPSPSDILRLSNSGIFVYVSGYMEPWAERLELKPGVKIVEAASGASCIRVAAGHAHEGRSHEHGRDGSCDPHVWMDTDNASKMVQAIADALSAKDPANACVYAANASAYQKRLKALDESYRKGLASCKVKSIIHSGHAAFAYLAARYGLSFVSSTGVTGDSEPVPSDLLALAREVRKYGAEYIFTEAQVNRRFADTVRAETGAQILSLHHIGSVSREEFASSSYLSMMEDNLAALEKGLSCRQ